MSKALLPKWTNSDKSPRHGAVRFQTMSLYRRKQSPIDVFIVDVLTMAVPSYKIGKELSIITASLNEVKRTGLRKAPLKLIAPRGGRGCSSQQDHKSGSRAGTRSVLCKAMSPIQRQ